MKYIYNINNIDTDIHWIATIGCLWCDTILDFFSSLSGLKKFFLTQ